MMSLVWLGEGDGPQVLRNKQKAIRSWRGQDRSKKGVILRDQRRVKIRKRGRNQTTRGRLPRKRKSRKKTGKERFGNPNRVAERRKSVRDSVLCTVDKGLHCPPSVVVP